MTGGRRRTARADPQQRAMEEVHNKLRNDVASRKLHEYMEKKRNKRNAFWMGKYGSKPPADDVAAMDPMGGQQRPLFAGIDQGPPLLKAPAFHGNRVRARIQAARDSVYALNPKPMLPPPAESGAYISGGLHHGGVGENAPRFEGDTAPPLDLEIAALKAIRAREDAIERLQVCCDKLMEGAAAHGGLLAPGDPIVRMFFRIIQQLRSRTLDTVEAVASWERASGGRPFVHKGLDYLAKVGPDCGFLDVIPSLQSRLRSGPAAGDPFLKELTVDGVAIEEATQRDIRQGRRVHPDALRMRMARKILAKRGNVRPPSEAAPRPPKDLSSFEPAAARKKKAAKHKTKLAPVVEMSTPRPSGDGEEHFPPKPSDGAMHSPRPFAPAAKLSNEPAAASAEHTPGRVSKEPLAHVLDLPFPAGDVAGVDAPLAEGMRPAEEQQEQGEARTGEEAHDEEEPEEAVLEEENAEIDAWLDHVVSELEAKSMDFNATAEYPKDPYIDQLVEDLVLELEASDAAVASEVVQQAPPQPLDPAKLRTERFEGPAITAQRPMSRDSVYLDEADVAEQAAIITMPAPRETKPTPAPLPRRNTAGDLPEPRPIVGLFRPVTSLDEVNEVGMNPEQDLMHMEGGGDTLPQERGYTPLPSMSETPAGLEAQRAAGEPSARSPDGMGGDGSLGPLLGDEGSGLRRAARVDVVETVLRRDSSSLPDEWQGGHISLQLALSADGTAVSAALNVMRLGAMQGSAHQPASQLDSVDEGGKAPGGAEPGPGPSDATHADVAAPSTADVADADDAAAGPADTDAAGRHADDGTASAASRHADDDVAPGPSSGGTDGERTTERVAVTLRAGGDGEGAVSLELGVKPELGGARAREDGGAGEDEAGVEKTSGGAAVRAELSCDAGEEGPVKLLLAVSE